MVDRPETRLLVEEGTPPGLDPEQARLLGYWTRLAAVADPPAWKRFDPLEVWPLVPCLVLLEILDGGADLLYRLPGGDFEDRVGRSLRGKRLSELYPEEAVEAACAKAREIQEDRRPQLREGALVMAEREHHRYRRLTLPFARKDAGPVAFLLVHYLFLDEG